MHIRSKSGPKAACAGITPIFIYIRGRKSPTARQQKNDGRKPSFAFVRCGWKMGLEPTTPGTTIQCSNRLSYIHHAIRFLSYRCAKIIQILLFAKKTARKLHLRPSLRPGTPPRSVTKWQSRVTKRPPESAKTGLAHRLL